MLAVLLALMPAELAASQPKTWIWESDDVSEREGKLFRFSPRLNFWIGNFDRPPRACKTVLPGFDGFEGFETRALRAQQIGGIDPFCPSDDSDELAFGTGVELAFRAFLFVYLTAGIDFVYTSPSFSSIKNQLIVAL